MKSFQLLSFVALFIFIVSCETPKSVENNSNENLNQLFDDYRSFQYFTYPEYASYEGIHDYSDRLTDQSIAAGDKYNDSIKAYKQTTLAIDRNQLTDENKLNYDMFLFMLNQDIDQNDLKIGSYLGFSQQNGFHVNFPQIIGYQPFNNESDVNKYLSRLKQFKVEAQNTIEGLKEGQSKGIVLPCNITTQVLSQLKSFAEMENENSPLYTVIESNKALELQKEDLAKVINDYVAPGYKSLYEYFKDEYHPNCRNEVGISSVKGGKAYYEFLIKKYTTSNQTPDYVFETGEKEVTRIKKEIKKVQAELGYPNLSLADFYDELKTNPKYYFTEKEDLLDGFRNILKVMDTKLPDLFGILPKTPYDLKEIEAYRAAAAPAAYYYNAPEDGSRPGYFYVNTYDLSARPKYTMTALALHEAVPGHHLQIALAKELENVPWFRKEMSVTAFVEGWGLYAEYLGYETGMYEDELQKMGALTFEMWRACRLVVDVGIHYKGWTRAEAIAFMKSNLPLSDLDIQSEIDRYIAWPGQAVAYKTGELKLKALRAKAEKQLGDKFDVKSFHDAVLENGSIPLSLLETKIDSWIEKADS